VYRRVVRELSEADGRRTGRDADDFEARVLFGALAGALMAVLDREPGSVELVYRALDFIEAGMPLK
jgi:MftR C-terminal domain